MQLGSTLYLRTSYCHPIAVLVAAWIVLVRGAIAGEFEAFSWARHHPASTDHVTPLVEIDPWTDLETCASRLRQLPAGKRFIIFSWVTEDLADHASDRCMKRTWEVRVVPAATAAGMRTSGMTMASAGRAPATSGPPSRSAELGYSATTVMPSSEAAPQLVAIDRPTPFRGPWMDGGIAAVRARVSAIMGRLRQLGADVDGVAVDNETTLHAACFLGRTGSLAAIESDPRWPSLARSMGLPTRISDMSWGSPLYFTWTERMAGRFDAAMQSAVMEPIRRFFPKAVVSNYCTGRMLGKYSSPDINGHYDRRITNGFGTHDNSEFYAWLADGRIAKAAGGAATDPSWVAFRAEVHKIRGMNASSTRPKHAWIAARSWPGVSWGWVPLADSPMWDELVIQLGMHGVSQFFELSIEDFGISRERNLEIRAADRAALNSVMSELNERLANVSMTAVLSASQPSWQDQVIATGRRAGQQVIWRFSFAPGVDAVKIRLTDGSELLIEAEEGRRGAWFQHHESIGIVTYARTRMPVVEIVEVCKSS